MFKTIILLIYIMVFKNLTNWFNKNLGLSSLLESKLVLYLLVFISIVNLYSYAMADEMMYAGIMMIVGFLSSFFNKNMIMIIFTSIAATNLIRFGMERYKNREGFTTDLTQLDALMNHMTDDKEIMQANTAQKNTKEETTVSKKDDFPVTEPDYDKNAKMNEDPTKRDTEIDKFIKNLNPAGILQKMEIGIDNSKVDIAKDKINLALKHTSKIANESQRKGVESLLNLQVKLLDQIVNISPLMDEFRDVVKMLDQ
jgi:hypothetical protein